MDPVAIRRFADAMLDIIGTRSHHVSISNHTGYRLIEVIVEWADPILGEAEWSDWYGPADRRQRTRTRTVDGVVFTCHQRREDDADETP